MKQDVFAFGNNFGGCFNGCHLFIATYLLSRMKDFASQMREMAGSSSW
jgi:hypothetical protein